MSVEKKIICPYRQDNFNGYVCKIATVDGSSNSTNRIVPEVCIENCGFYKVYEQIQCDALCPTIVIRKMSNYNHYLVDFNALVCKHKEISFDLRFPTFTEECTNCGLKSSNVTKQIYSLGTTLLENALLPKSAKTAKSLYREIKEGRYEDVVTKSYSFMETILKEILEKKGCEVEKIKELKKLWREYRSYCLQNVQKPTEYLLNSMNGLLLQLGSVRNEYSSAHGSIDDEQIDMPLAELCVNITMTLATFIARIEIGENDESR